ncbi:MAG: tRNA preQ1(34) S-adenosylmethionine ribosyltransferase-isomerase QueA [Gammaproteobacteria bacterium CG22_combo_CG10-13_8_21_14_all_40_8]|nr:MAG: tRNA preQ1(34) S-adenosylmethionine ribosyltransferase-isomerase QueA [Gammaproteobacteria bacterium CG22_combo_CG10-13_8_21_14_all_40_8]
MKTSDFDYHLPEQLIARYPLPERTSSRMLCLNRANGAIAHHQFNQLIDFIQSGDLFVFNNTRVIPARLLGHRESGGKVEVMIERIVDPNHCLAHVRASNKVPEGSLLNFAENAQLRVLGREGDLFKLESSSELSLLDLVETQGHMPLPPYLEREDEMLDKERYQTVYAKEQGAVAAPTAGLHFDQKILQALVEKGVDLGFVTLHVGAGTFQPVRVEDITKHQMHSEYIEVSEQLCQQVAKTRQKGGRVIAIGTTSVRCLETAAQSGELKPYQGDTHIFIYPGYQFKVIDKLLTNFHLPKSSLIMLVSALAGKEAVMQAYQQAIENQYRFYSYGDAMLIG